MNPWATKHKFLCAFFRWFCRKQSLSTIDATRTIVGVFEGIVTLLTTLIFRDGTFAGNGVRLCSVEPRSCGRCCDVTFDAILRSCLESVVPVSATDGA